MSKQGSRHTYQLRYILKGQAHKLQTMEKHNKNPQNTERSHNTPR